MKVFYIFLILFFGIGCNIKPKSIKDNPKTYNECDSCVEIFGFFIHKSSPKIFTIDHYRGGDLKDTLFRGVYCEVYDISKENTSFLIKQVQRNKYFKLPMKNIQIPLLTKYLGDADTGYYEIKHAGGDLLGFDRYLILNLSKNYFIWFQNG